MIFGEGGVGKTSLTHRYLRRVFQQDIKMTLGADFAIKRLEVEGRKATLRIWDFAGEERFRVLLPGYVSGASGAIFMYDITRYSTLLKIDDWLTMFKGRTVDGSQRQIPILMVGGKSDLEDKRSVPIDEAERVCQARDLQGYMECSAKTGDNVDDVFEFITIIMMDYNDML